MVQKCADRLGHYKAGKLEGQEAGKLNYLRAFQPHSLQASQLPSLWAISYELFCPTPERWNQSYYDFCNIFVRHNTR